MSNDEFSYPPSLDFATVNDWVHDTDRYYEELVCACLGMATEIERLRKIIDSRPAINAGLVESYIEWTQGICAADFSRATETAQ